MRQRLIRLTSTVTIALVILLLNDSTWIDFSQSYPIDKQPSRWLASATEDEYIMSESFAAALLVDLFVCFSLPKTHTSLRYI